MGARWWIGVVAALVGSTWFPAHAQPDAGVRLDIDFGRHLYAQGEYRLAAEELERFVTAHPRHPDADEAGFLAADCWVQLGDWPQAARRLRAFLASYPLSPWSDHARFRLAACEFEMGRYARAESLYLAVGPGPDATEALFWAGEAAFRRGELRRAAELLGRAMAALPAGEMRGIAARHRAEALLKVGHPSEARQLLWDLVKSPDAQPEDALSLAILLLEAGQPAEAEEVLLGMGGRWPAREESRLHREVRARCAWELGRREEALGLLSSRPAESPRLLAWMLLQEGRAAEARDVLVPAMRRLEGIERAEAALLLGAALREEGQLASADSVLQVESAGITDRGLLSRAILLRAAVQHDLGRLEEARRTLDRGLRSLATRADSVEAFVRLAHLSAAQDRFDEAARFFLEARDSAEGNEARHLALQALLASYRAHSWDKVDRLAQALVVPLVDSLGARAAFWRAEALARQGRWTEAEAAYRVALSGLPTEGERADALFGRAWALLSLERPEEAVEEFRRAASTASGGDATARALVRAGDVLMALGRYADAASSYRGAAQTIARREVGDEALLGLGRALSMAGETDEAVEVLDRLFRASPTGDLADDALFEKGEALFRAGRFDAAEGAYRLVLDLRRDRELRGKALYRIGDCQYNRGEYSSARATYVAVVQGYPDSDFWAFALQGALWAEQQSRGAERALALCDSLLERPWNDPRRDALILAKADLLAALGRDEEAAPLYRELHRPDADLRAAWCLRARPQEARRAFEEVARRWPDSPEAAEALYQAAMFARRDDPQAARRLLRELLSTYPRSDLRDAAWYELGATFAAEPESALPIMRTLVRTGRAEWRDRAWVSGAEAHLAAGRPDSALVWAERALERASPVGAKAHWVAASAYLAKHDSTEARRLLLRLAYRFPNDSLAAAANRAASTLAVPGRKANP